MQRELETPSNELASAADNTDATDSALLELFDEEEPNNTIESIVDENNHQHPWD